jgi:hypothetical protein
MDELQPNKRFGSTFKETACLRGSRAQRVPPAARLLRRLPHLSVAFDAGSASVHRSHTPDQDQINTVMDIVENMLQSLFVLEASSIEWLKSLVLPRGAE